MSNVDLETQMQRAKGEGVFLTPEERATVKRFLSYPEDFPPEFKEWLIDFMAVNIPQIPYSQILGFDRFTSGLVTVSAATSITASETCSATAYGDIAGGTVGPQLQGLSDGQYIFLFGCYAAAVDVNEAAQMGLSINGAAVSGIQIVFQHTSSGTTRINLAQSTALSATLSDGTNSVVAKYRTSSGAVAFDERWLIAMKIGS